MTDQQFRDLMAGVCSPVSIVTTADRDEPHGATVSSLASLSLHPALVSIALDRGSRLLERILAVGRFGVNVLAAGQEDIAMAFARARPSRFSSCSWSWSQQLPRVDHVAGWAACELWQTWEAGDHLLLAGQVSHAESVPAAPLVFCQRTFGSHSRLRIHPQTPITELIAACAR